MAAAAGDSEEQPSRERSLSYPYDSSSDEEEEDECRVCRGPAEEGWVRSKGLTVRNVVKMKTFIWLLFDLVDGTTLYQIISCGFDFEGSSVYFLDWLLCFSFLNFNIIFDIFSCPSSSKHQTQTTTLPTLQMQWFHSSSSSRLSWVMAICQGWKRKMRFVQL